MRAAKGNSTKFAGNSHEPYMEMFVLEEQGERGEDG